MTPERKNSLLGYIDQLKALSGGPVDEEDLYAAGYDEGDLNDIGWFDQQQAYTPTEEPVAQLDPYTPTKRERLHDMSTRGLEDLGVPKNISQDIADKMIGSEFGPIAGMGAIDFTPFGLPLGVQEGSNAMERGYNSGDAIGMGLGAVEAVGAALPMGKAVSKFGKKIIDKGVEAYNPNVARTFFGPDSKLADHDKLKTAQIMEQEGQTPEDIWQKTGWWNSPNGGWKFEVSDHELVINPAGRTNEEVFQHPQFYEALRPSDNLEELPWTEQDSQAWLTGQAPARYRSKDEAPSGERGSYDPQTKGISLYTKDDVWADPHEVAVHEMQHAAQAVEGAPGKGTNPQWIANVLAESLESLPTEFRSFARAAVESSVIEEHLKRIDDILPLMESRVEKLSKRDPSAPGGWGTAGLEQAQESLELLKERKGAYEQILPNYKEFLKPAQMEAYLGKVDPEFEDIVEDLKVIGKNIGASDKVPFETALRAKSPFEASNSLKLKSGPAHTLYELEKGEWEARLAGSRASMSPEERAANFPMTSSDILPRDEEFLFSMDELMDWAKRLKGYSASKKGYAKGGAVELDPISGNEVPPGAEPQEVRDDVDAKLSEGEYVIPADVVRYLGLDKIEKLVAQAKEGLAEMDKNGRIGGEDIVEEDDLPFSDEELFAEEAPVEMAVGGLIPAAGDRIRSQVGVTPNTTMPLWMQDQNFGSFQEEQNTTKDDSRQQPQQVSKWDRDVSQWSPEQFSQAVTQRNSLGTKVIETGISKMMPFGGLALRAKNNYINKNAPIAIDKMLKSGMDAQGNPLTDQQKIDLAKAKTDLAATAKQKPGLGGMVMKEIKGLIDRRTPEEKAKAEAEKAAKEKAEKDAKDKAAKDKADKDRASKDRPSKDKDDKGSKGKK